MSSLADVAVVVLSWNGWADTRDCLASLKAEPCAVVVVDNGSSDGSPDLIRAAFPEVDVVEAGENLGFCLGNNLGVERALAAGAETVVLLNNDTVVEPGFLAPLLEALDEPDVGFACPVIVRADDPEAVWFGGGRIDWRTGWPVHVQSAPATAAETPFGTGCCLAARRDVWERVGLLDPRFFLFWEDADWSVRATRAGYRGVLVPTSRIRHKVSSSFQDGLTGLGTFYFVRNGFLFIRKHAPRPWRTSLRFALEHAVAPSLRELRRRDRGAVRLGLLRASGVLAGVLRAYGPAPRIAR